MRTNPLYRALRLDKVRIALLHRALRNYLEGGVESLPVWRMTAAKDLDTLRSRLKLPPQGVRWVTLKSQTGGGSNPESSVDSLGVEMTHSALSPQQLKEKFAQSRVPILGYIKRNAFYLDVRTFFPDDFADVQSTVDELWAAG
jgi:L-seryl-tRNA(Ser) seleniumtransferase